MGQVRVEVRPAVDFDEQVGQVDNRQLVGDLPGQLVDSRLARLGTQALGVQVAVLVDAHVRFPVGDVAVKLLDVLGGALGQLHQPGLGRAGQIELADRRGASGEPVLAGDEKAPGVGVAAAAGDPDVTGAQRAANLGQQAQPQWWRSIPPSAGST